MICPKCGSENVQFSTNTSGGGFGAGKGCCGYMILGPIGLLCGACGSGTTTEEFWICHNCGYKFSNSEGKSATSEAAQKEATAQQIAANCEQYKKDLGDKSLSYYREQYELAQIKTQKANDEYEQKFNEMLNKYSSEYKSVKKYRRKYLKHFKFGCATMITIVVLGILLCVVGLIPVGAVFIGIGCLMAIISAFKESNLKEKVEKIFIEKEPTFKNYIYKKESTKEDEKYWKEFDKKAEYIEKNDK